MNGLLEERLAKTRRRALVAQEFPDPTVLASLCRQGSGFLAGHGEAWPERAGLKLVPILAVYTPELPYIPDFLAGHRYWTFFIQADRFEQAVGDGSLVVRRYVDTGELRRLPDFEQWPGSCLRFSEVADYPSSYALQEALAGDRGLAAALEVDQAEVAVRFPCHSGLKLGGYPCMIQGTHFLKTLEPDFQVQVDVCDTYAYGDSGIGFIYANLQATIWECM